MRTSTGVISPVLTEVHVQRLRLAVDAHFAGGRVRFRKSVDPESRLIVWVDEKTAPRREHVIRNFCGRADIHLRAVETKFQELVAERKKPS